MVLEVGWGEPHFSEQVGALCCHPRLSYGFNTLESESDRVRTASPRTSPHYGFPPKDTELPGDCLIPGGASMEEDHFPHFPEKTEGRIHSVCSTGQSLRTVIIASFRVLQAQMQQLFIITL